MDFEMRRRQLQKQLQEEIEKDNEPVLCGKKKKKKKKKKNSDEAIDEPVMTRIHISPLHLTQTAEKQFGDIC